MRINLTQGITSRRSFIKTCVSTTVLTVAGSKLLTACTSEPVNSEASEASEAIESSPSVPATPDKVTFVTSWFAQAEHGGYYQAVATGIYEKYGLDVTVQMGGPQVNNTQLLMGGLADFIMGTDSLVTLTAVQENIPKIAVAAIFQKSPRVIVAHPEVKSLEELRGQPVYVAGTADVTFWPFLKAQYGFDDSQKRPYNFSIAPFLQDKNSAQQAFLSSEPFSIEKEGGFMPSIFLLADMGYNPYGSVIETKRELVESNPDLVQRFVNATIEGYASYLENPAPANELIKKDNPKMTDEQLAFGVEKMKEYGLIVSGDSEAMGIGAMTDARWEEFFTQMVEYGILDAQTDYKQAYTLQFVNQKVGV
ncbi:MAG: ABC transporter substrate-binding protein [Elainellaceae cyanobacterium]